MLAIDANKLRGINKFEHLSDLLDSLDFATTKTKTARTYLNLLGYLKQDSGSSKLTVQFKTALNHFQEELGLPASDNLDQHSWTILHRLTSFEQPSTCPSLIERYAYTPAMQRAVALRLRILGLLPAQHSLADIETGLTAFKALLHKIAWDLPSQSKPHELLQRLFTYDELVRRINAYQVKHNVSLGINHHLIKIELYLLGFDISPSAAPHRPFTHGEIYRYQQVSKTSTRYSARSARAKYFHALIEFWRTQAYSLARAQREAKSVNLTTLDKLVNSTQASQDKQTYISVNQLEQQVLSLPQKKQKDLLELELNRQGSRLYDGIQRVLKNFVSRFRKYMSALYVAIKNIARLLLHYAQQGYRQIKTSLQTAAESIKMLFETEVAIPPEAPVLIMQRTKNCDFNLLVEPDADEQMVRAASGFICERLNAVTSAIRILADLIKTTLSILQLSSHKIVILLALTKTLKKYKLQHL